MTDIQSGFDTIFREAFFGIKPGESGTWFVEKSEGFFNAIENLTASEASKRAGSDVSCIAAHTDHARYYIEVSNAFMRGEKPKLDWEGSWKNQTVDELEWAAIRADLRVQVDTLLAAVANHEPKNADETAGLFAGVAHAAFHLGAIRQLLKLL